MRSEAAANRELAKSINMPMPVRRRERAMTHQTDSCFGKLVVWGVLILAVVMVLS